MPTRSLEDCLKAEGGLTRLTGHATRLLRLQRVFESAVPRPLSRGARIANLKLGRLIIHADSGAVAAKLRQIIPTLGEVFRHEAAEVTGIDVKVQPHAPSRTQPVGPSHAPLGSPAKQGLTSLADRLPADSHLSKALRRLVESS